jgi:hypothetical protein
LAPGDDEVAVGVHRHRGVVLRAGGERVDLKLRADRLDAEQRTSLEPLDHVHVKHTVCGHGVLLQSWVDRYKYERILKLAGRFF